MRLLTYAADTDSASAAALKLDLRATSQNTRKSPRSGDGTAFIGRSVADCLYTIRAQWLN